MNNETSPINEWLKKRNKQKANHKKLVNRLMKINSKKLILNTVDIHEKVFKNVNCLDCANCCKSIPPIVNETDAKRVAKHLGMKITEFKEKYLKIDEDMDMVMNQSPCPFLQDDNKCLVYEYRPKACREYPHTDEYEFATTLKLHAINTKYCPAVFHMLEELKTQI